MEITLSLKSRAVRAAIVFAVCLILYANHLLVYSGMPHDLVSWVFSFFFGTLFSLIQGLAIYVVCLVVAWVLGYL